MRGVTASFVQSKVPGKPGWARKEANNGVQITAELGDTKMRSVLFVYSFEEANPGHLTRWLQFNLA